MTINSLKIFLLVVLVGCIFICKSLHTDICNIKVKIEQIENNLNQIKK